MSSQLRRVARWGILVVILIEIVLVRGRFLTTTTAVAVAAAFESMTILLGSLQALRATRRIIVTQSMDNHATCSRFCGASPTG